MNAEVFTGKRHKKYAGCGARSTPKKQLKAMAEISSSLSDQGWMLRSGAAIGADSAFEEGCTGAKEIYIPWEGYNGRRSRSSMDKGVYVGATALTIEHAMRYHPNPAALKQGVKKLHARNSAILCGLDLNNPVDMLICWTPYGEVVGGTGQAMRIAIENGIPVFNLALDKDWDLLKQWFFREKLNLK